jgi:hypothetical protein
MIIPFEVLQKYCYFENRSGCYHKNSKGDYDCSEIHCPFLKELQDNMIDTHEVLK